MIKKPTNSTKPINKGVDYRRNDMGGRKHKSGYGY